MKVIITGGEGFIGRSLAAYFSRRDVDVVSVDRLNGLDVAEYFTHNDLQGVDLVYHLAASTSVFNTDHEQIMADNCAAFMAVCDTCRARCIPLVYASSSTANACNTTSLYGISKRFDEEYARCYYPKATGVRLHNVYGPNPRQGTLLWHLLHDNRVRLVNGGRNVRHFTYIDDAVQGLVYAYACNKPLINVANPQEMSVRDFANLVCAQNHADIAEVAEMRPFDKIAQSVDTAIYTVPLPYITVEEGIRRVFAAIHQGTSSNDRKD